MFACSVHVCSPKFPDDIDTPDGYGDLPVSDVSFVFSYQSSDANTAFDCSAASTLQEQALRSALSAKWVRMTTGTESSAFNPTAFFGRIGKVCDLM